MTGVTGLGAARLAERGVEVRKQTKRTTRALKTRDAERYELVQAWLTKGSVGWLNDSDQATASGRRR